MNLRVVPPDPAWPDAFRSEARRIRTALDGPVRSIHHIGSTAVPGIHAKPIIDILLEVSDLAALDARTPAMAALGYEALGEFGIPRRRYFRRNSGADVRTHQVHAFPVGDVGIQRHLAFATI